jgi:hypothetical protein
MPRSSHWAINMDLDSKTSSFDLLTYTESLDITHTKGTATLINGRLEFISTKERTP